MVLQQGDLHGMKKIEIVVPCYNEEECVVPLYEAVVEVFRNVKNYTFSMLFVNDGSKDNTLQKLKELKTRVGNQIEYISFARNFGKEAAIYAGLYNSSGDYVVLMDADLQHPPAIIPQMIEAMEEGYDCCGARRVSRKGEPIVRSAFSRLFYNMINKITMMNLVQGGSDYRMMTRQMVEAMLLLGEKERFTKGIMSWVGFDTKWIEYENVERIAGKSKWSFAGLIRYALSGFIAFANAPLRVVIYLGFVVVGISFLYAFTVFVSALVSDAPRTGFSTIIILLLLMSGIIISLLGVIGEYLARIYIEIKNRPIYIEKENSLKKGTGDIHE